VGVRSIAMRDVSVCLSARVSQEPHDQTSRNVLYVLAAAVPQSCDDVLCTGSFVDDIMS